MPGWTVPDKGEGANDIQSILFQEYLEVLADGVGGRNCVLSGCLVTAQGTPDMTVAVAKGAVLSNGALFPVTAGNVTVTAANGTNPRIDLIVVNSAGTKTIRTGTAAANPKPPARSLDDVVLAAVYVPANDTAINSNQITDMRVLRTQGPIVIYKRTTDEVTNTSSAAIHLLNKAGSGLTIPNGLLTAGRALRVRIAGNWLGNSGTPTLTFAVSFGGTTMFSDVSGAITADTDRKPFYVDLLLMAQSNTDQTLRGQVSLNIIGGLTAPTTGQGDAWSTAMAVAPIGGSSAVDTDAADRVLAVTWTFSVSAAANEMVVEAATVELL